MAPPYRERAECPVRDITQEDEILFLRWLPCYARLRTPPVANVNETVIFYMGPDIKSLYEKTDQDKQILADFGKLSEDKKKFRDSADKLLLITGADEVSTFQRKMDNPDVWTPPEAYAYVMNPTAPLAPAQPRPPRNDRNGGGNWSNKHFLVFPRII